MIKKIMRYFQERATKQKACQNLLAIMPSLTFAQKCYLQWYVDNLDSRQFLRLCRLHPYVITKWFLTSDIKSVDQAVSLIDLFFEQYKITDKPYIIAFSYKGDMM